MYVFYDKNGDIKAITPNIDKNLENIYFMVTFPLSEVEMFLTARKNTFDYQIKRFDKLDGTTYKFIKKTSNVIFTRTLDSYLTKVDDTTPYGAILTITNVTYDNVIIVELAKEFREIYENNSEDQEGLLKFINSGPSALYLTRKNNPYHLLFSCIFSPKELFSVERLYFNYDGNYTDVSIYTKKLINGYVYKEKIR
jgi:hypothetical protein